MRATLTPPILADAAEERLRVVGDEVAAGQTGSGGRRICWIDSVEPTKV